MTVQTTDHVVRVRVRDGKPQCPDGCGDMAQNAEGLWSCPIGDAQWDYIRAALRDYFDEVDA